MAKQATRIQEGKVIDYTLTGTVANGDIVPLALKRVGVALSDGVFGDTIALAIDEVFEIAAATADKIVVGDIVNWDSTNKVVTTDSTVGSYAGVAVSTKGAGEAGTVLVHIGLGG